MRSGREKRLSLGTSFLFPYPSTTLSRETDSRTSSSCPCRNGNRKKALDARYKNRGKRRLETAEEGVEKRPKKEKEMSAYPTLPNFSTLSVPTSDTNTDPSSRFAVYSFHRRVRARSSGDQQARRSVGLGSGRSSRDEVSGQPLPPLKPQSSTPPLPFPTHHFRTLGWRHAEGQARGCLEQESLVVRCRRRAFTLSFGPRHPPSPQRPPPSSRHLYARRITNGKDFYYGTVRVYWRGLGREKGR